jgi:hypothetical protein
VVIAAAVRARKIVADQADNYRRMYDADPAAIRRLLTAPVAQGGLAAGIVPAATSIPILPEEEYAAEWVGPSQTPGHIARGL